MMKKEAQINPKRWQDWAIIAIRFALLITVLLVLFVNQTHLFSDYSVLIIPIGTVCVANALLALWLMFPRAQNALPAVVTVGDIAIAVALTYVIGDQPHTLLIVAVTLAVSGLLRVGWMWGSLQVLGVFAAIGAVLLLTVAGFERELERYVPFAILTLGTTIALGCWTYFRDEYTKGQNKRLTQITRQKENELNDMRERTRAISQMATTLNGTLNYAKILDAALDIGRVSIRKENKSRITSMVLLFHSQNETLYIANHRGLSHNDAFRTLDSDSGIIGNTLEKCIPIITKEVNKDPQLNLFVSMQGMRSALCIPLRAGYDNYGVVLYASDSSNAFDEDRVEALMAISTQATIALQNAVLYRHLMEEKERIIEMEENARKALVRDLHDIPTQTIAAVAMRIRIIQKLLERNSPEVPEELKTVEEMALRASEEIRHVLFKLRPLALESQGLTAALNQLAEKLQKTYKQNVAMRISSDIETYLDQNAQGVIFYLIEEAVNNARKYAEAPLITVQLGRKGDVVIVRIADNGKGFNIDAVDAANERGSYGMTNMRERAQLLDGTLKVESAQNVGTTITVTIPIPERETRRAHSNGQNKREPQSKLAATAASRINT